MTRRSLLLVSILLALAPMVAGASVLYTWDSGLDDWGPRGSATDCVWVSGSGHDGAGAMRAGLSCLSPQFAKDSGVSVDAHFWIASNFSGWNGRVAVVLDPYSETLYCASQLWSTSTDDTVWDQQIFECTDSAVVSASAFHLLIDYAGAGVMYVDDLAVVGSPAAGSTPTPAILATATPTFEPIIVPATPTPIPTWAAVATPTAVPAPAFVPPATPTPGADGDLYFPVSGSGLLPWASDFLSDWSAIIGPAALAALSGIVLLKLADFMRR